MKYSQTKARILVTDDEPNILKIYETYLKVRPSAAKNGAGMKELVERLFETSTVAPPPMNFKVTACSQGREAIAKVQEAWDCGQPFQVAFIDIRMPPGIDGITTAEEIRKIDPFIELVIVTAFSDVTTAEIVERVPPADKLLYLQKPLHAQEIWQFTTALSTKWHAERRREAARQREQHEAEIKLEESEELFRLLTEYTPVAIHGYTTNGVINYWNQAAETTFGYSSDEAKGKTAEDIIIDEKTKDAYQKLISAGQQVSASGEFSVQEEVTLRTKDGRKVPVHSIHTAVCIDENTPPLLFRIDIDQSERKKAEAALINSSRMSAVGTLASGVAHEFNNIHAITQGYLDLIKCKDNVPEDIREFINIAYSALVRGSKITKQLLEFSSQDITKKHTASLATITYNTLIMVRNEFEAEGIVFKINLIDDDMVYVDAAQISQVILNLLINARHAVIDSQVKQITISSKKEKDMIYLSISDSGCGISEENIGKIFTPFFSTKGEHSLGATSMSKVKGTGLGLSVSQTIITNHDGVITAKSQIEAGATFTIKLPPATTTDNSTKVSEEESTQTKKISSVLVIDDEKDIRDLLRYQLRSSFEVTGTDDGYEAIKLIKEGSFDLVMLDLQMPKMNGVDFLKEIKNLPPEKQPTVIVITGKSTIDNLIPKDLESLVSKTLFKPFCYDDLLSTIDKVVNLT